MKIDLRDGLLELRQVGGDWKIGSVERGQFSELAGFESEKAAVKDFLHRFPQSKS